MLLAARALDLVGDAAPGRAVWPLGAVLGMFALALAALPFVHTRQPSLAHLPVWLPVALAAAAAKAFILSDADIYFYVTTRPPPFYAALALVLAAAALSLAAALWLLARYGLSLPATLLHGLKLRAALRESAQATDGVRRTLLLALVGWAAVSLLAYAALAALTGWLLAVLAPPGLPLRSLRIVSLSLAAMAAGGAMVLARGMRAGLAAVLVWIWRRAPHAASPERATEPDMPPPPRRAVRMAACGAVLLVAVAHGVWAFAPGGEHRVLVTAHRAGSARAPENTLAALAQAVADGADYVEVDAQETADGEVVLLHDTDLRRVAGVPRSIWQMPYDEIRNLDIGSWFAPRFAAERIPTLLAFAAAARGHVRLNVEAKVNGHGVDLARRILAALDATAMRGDTIITSLDLGILRQVRALAPDMPVGLIVATGVGDLTRVDIDLVALSRRWATPARIAAIAASGRRTAVWTLDDEQSLAAAMLDGADNVITGDPRLGIAVRRWFDDLTPAERAILQVQNRLTGRDRLTGMAEAETP
jgi:glycerophosphoryl diester phosphodiesterase